jgi:amphi-Trp domain-containing protein
MAKKDRKDQDTHYAARHTAEEAATYIDSLVAALRNGSAIVETESESLQIKVGPNLTMELQARSSGSEGKKASIRVRLSWTEPQASPLLSISSDSSD